MVALYHKNYLVFCFLNGKYCTSRDAGYYILILCRLQILKRSLYPSYLVLLFDISDGNCVALVEPMTLRKVYKPPWIRLIMYEMEIGNSLSSAGNLLIASVITKPCFEWTLLLSVTYVCFIVLYTHSILPVLNKYCISNTIISFWFTAIVKTCPRSSRSAQ